MNVVWKFPKYSRVRTFGRFMKIDGCGWLVKIWNFNLNVSHFVLCNSNWVPSNTQILTIVHYNLHPTKFPLELFICSVNKSAIKIIGALENVLKSQIKNAEWKENSYYNILETWRKVHVIVYILFSIKQRFLLPRFWKENCWGKGGMA